MSKLSSLATAKDCAAKASLASTRSTSSIFMPAFSSAFLVLKAGPTPMMDGSSPAEAPTTNLAIGFTPSSFAFSSLITTIAAAPSLMPEAFAAVTVPSALNAGRSLLMPSAVTPARGPSSLSNITVSFLTLTGTGTISSLKRPSAQAFSHFCWLEAANSSCISRVRPYFSATFSAVIPI